MNRAWVTLWGSRIGAIFWPEDALAASFEYTPEFADSGIEVAPLVMPLSRRVYSFPALAERTFHGLPGLVADSLPDRYGQALIDAWLARTGRDAASFGPVDRLCYVGRRGMGGLEFEPAIGPDASESERVDVAALTELASEVLAARAGLRGSLAEDDREASLAQLLRVGTSAGGARAKAVVAFNQQTGELRSGQLDLDSGFEHWMLKFDGVAENRDRELADPLGYGALEYAYSLMAREAGVEMTACRLLDEGPRRHFMTRRFDRTVDGGKLHMQTLCALAHYDYNAPGVYAYEQALRVVRQLSLGMGAIEQLFRRMVFNLVARNQDDHVKNIAFLMDRAGRWRLAPAYDVTYSYNPAGLWTSRHQMTVNGKRDAFVREDLRAVARGAVMRRGRADAILDEVVAVVRRWEDFADRVGVDPRLRDGVTPALRLEW